jgi:hypothetical protein
MKLHFNMSLAVALIYTTNCLSGEDVAISISDISSYYSQDLPRSLESDLISEVKSKSFHQQIYQTAAAKIASPIELSIEIRLATEDTIGSLTLCASVSKVDSATANKILKSIEKYVKCRVRGYSSKYAILIALPPTEINIRQYPTDVRSILKEYPLVAPDLLIHNGVQKEEDRLTKIYVVKDDLFLWFYDVIKIDGEAELKVRERRIKNTKKQ